MKKAILILTAASMVAVGGCKSRQAENVSNAPAEANISENYPEEMNAVPSTANNAAAEMNVPMGNNEMGGKNAAAVTNNTP